MATAALAAGPSPAAAEANGQIWGALTLQWVRSESLTLGVDVEPKLLVAKEQDAPGWATLDVTPKAEFSRGKWFDVVGELHLGRTRQTDDQDSVEVTPRLGFRLHIFSDVVGKLIKERQSRRRFVLRSFARVEWRNLYYSDDTPQSFTRRFRDRVETAFPLNRPRVTDDGALYTSADVEWFWTRQSPPEVLYVWDRSRDSARVW